jgi:hypothetical protein
VRARAWKAKSASSASSRLSRRRTYWTSVTTIEATYALIMKGSDLEMARPAGE